MSRRTVTALAIAAATAVTVLPPGHSSVFAQPSAPSVEEMVRALTPQARTRSLGGATRNLQPMLDLTIHFDFDSASIRAESKKPLQDLAQALQDGRLASFRFRVEGHTDGKGTAKYNDELSARRAQAVTEFLALNGMPANRLEAQGKGFSQLLNRAHPDAAENRRVRIVTVD